MTMGKKMDMGNCTFKNTINTKKAHSSSKKSKSSKLGGAYKPAGSNVDVQCSCTTSPSNEVVITTKVCHSGTYYAGCCQAGKGSGTQCTGTESSMLGSSAAPGGTLGSSVPVQCSCTTSPSNAIVTSTTQCQSGTLFSKCCEKGQGSATHCTGVKQQASNSGTMLGSSAPGSSVQVQCACNTSPSNAIVITTKQCKSGTYYAGCCQQGQSSSTQCTGTQVA